MKKWVVIVLPLLSSGFMVPQASAVGLKNGIFEDGELSFRYTPPKGLNDETLEGQQEVRDKAAKLHTTNTLDMLLRMTSRTDDTVPEWRAVVVETYPRSRVADLDDKTAEAKMNVWVAGPGVAQVGSPEHLFVRGHAFVASSFERSEPPRLKHGRVYRTIWKGKLIAFAFTANSADMIPLLSDSLQTLDFAEDKLIPFLGFDRNQYPGDANLQELHKTFAFTGYWLNNPPGEETNTWTGKRRQIEAAGFGFAVLFNGRLYRELKNNAAGVGKSDGQAAVAGARREGFPPRTIIFLDQEQGGRLLPEQKAYLFAWIDEVAQAGFRAGVYCSGMVAREEGGGSIVTADDIRENAGSREITYWVTNDACPPSPGCVASQQPPSPNASGVDFADVWQFAQSPKRKDVAGSCRGYAKDGNCYPSTAAAQQRLHVDMNSSQSPDPSHGRTWER